MKNTAAVHIYANAALIVGKYGRECVFITRYFWQTAAEYVNANAETFQLPEGVVIPLEIPTLPEGGKYQVA